jgi:membrane-associated protease RseP (regulator of RpoE activity)
LIRVSYSTRSAAKPPTGHLCIAKDVAMAVARRISALFVSGLMIAQTRQFDPREVNFGRLATCYVAEGSAASAAGFRKCDAIESIDGTAARSLDDVYAALSKVQRERREAIVEVKRPVGPKGRSIFSYTGLSLPADDLRWVTLSP